MISLRNPQEQKLNTSLNRSVVHTVRNSVETSTHKWFLGTY